MLQRSARLRREYLFRKNEEVKELATLERKRKLKEAIDNDKPIPTELKARASKLKRQIDLDDPKSGVSTHMDDEYAQAGVEDPVVIITTSRDPSSRLMQFAKEMRLMFPNAQRINRGNMDMQALVQACKANHVTDLILFTETRGEPDGMIVSHFPHGPTAYFNLSNAILRHDIANRGTVSEAYPHLVFHGFSSTLGERIMSVLRFLFPVPKADAKRVVSFVNVDDVIAFRHHNFAKGKGKDVELVEIGPRFEMRPFQIKLGTLEVRNADVEWVLRPYMNTAKKRRVLT